MKSQQLKLTKTYFAYSLHRNLIYLNDLNDVKIKADILKHFYVNWNITLFGKM